MQSVYSLKERIMLTCVHSPIEPMRVVEQDEAERLKSTGVWFDCPTKAQKYREDIESEIKDESKPKSNGRKK